MAESKAEPTITDAAGRALLRKILMRARWDNQGGFPSYLGEGEWAFIETGLPSVTPEELNALHAFAGIVPDKIVPIGSCGTCKFAKDGHERGWEAPCVSCRRPKMSNYEPLS